MMRTTLLVTLALLTVAALAQPAAARPLDEAPEVQGNCVVEDDQGPRDYEVCLRTDGSCPRVTFRGWFGQGSIPYCL